MSDQVNRTRWAAAALLAVAAGCGKSDDGATPVTATEVFLTEGPPTMFSVECGHHALDAETGNWEPQEEFVRIEMWIYARTDGAEVVTLVNGEVIARKQTDDDYSQYPGPGIDPRVYGCGEPVETVETVLAGTRLLTTEGSAVESDLDLDGVQLRADYYAVNAGASGVQAVYANDQLIGMVTL